MTPLLTELLHFLLLLAAYALPVEAFAPGARAMLYAAFAAAYAVAAVVRRTSRRFWTFALPLAALLALPFVLSFPPSAPLAVQPGVVLFAGLAAIGLRAVYQRWSPRAQEGAFGSLPGTASALVLVIALDAVALWQAIPGLPALYFAVGVLYLLLALLRWHAVSLRERTERFAATPTQPAARVVRFNRILLGVSLAGTLVLLLLSPFLHLDLLLLWIGQRLLDLLRALVRLLSGDGTPEPSPTPSPVPSSPSPTPEGGGPVVPEAPAWLRFLLEAAWYVLAAAAALLVVAGLAYLAVRVYRSFYEVRRPDRDRRERLRPGEAEASERGLGRGAGRTLLPAFLRTPEERIREACRRLVASQARRGAVPAGAATARELLLALDAEAHPELREALALYEKARYGPGRCTAGDAARMRHLVRGLSRKDLRRGVSPSRGAPSGSSGDGS